MSYFILRVFQTECYLAIVDRGFLQVVMPPKKRIQSFYETAVGEGDVGGELIKTEHEPKPHLVSLVNWFAS